MNQKNRLLILGLMSFIILFLNLISASNLCWVDSSAANCLSSVGGQVVMHLSGVTNAHGELASQNSFTNVLCCNFGNGNTSCSSTLDPTTGQPVNKILGLAAVTNAHSESGGLTLPYANYKTYNVCYDSNVLSQCEPVNAGANCGTGKVEMIYLASGISYNYSNSHIESTGLSPQNYGTKICCIVTQPSTNQSHAVCQSGTCLQVSGPGINSCVEIGASCIIPNQTHSICVDSMCFLANGAGTNQCASNADCNLPAQHTICQNSMCTVVSGDGISQCGVVNGNCTIINPNYSVCLNNMCLLTNGVGTNQCSGNAGCLPPGNGSCSITSASWSTTQTLENRSVNLNIATSNCIDGTQIYLRVYKLGTLGNTPCRNINGCNDPVDVSTSEQTATGTWFAYPGSDSNNYTFTATFVSTGTSIGSLNSLQVRTEPPSICTSGTVVNCANYLNQQDCINDICDVANNSIPPDQANCNAPGTTCFCLWNSTANICEGGWNKTSFPTHPICLGTTCALTSLPGTNQCGLQTDCNNISQQHSVCQNNQCVQVSGIGVDQCLPISSVCNITFANYSICVGKTCMLSDGSGTNQCGSNPDCMNATPQHSVCQNDMCVVVNGDGINQCGPIGSSCSTPGFCGDGVIGPGEQCDGTNWGPINGCSYFGLSGSGGFCNPPGTPNQCEFNTSSCIGTPGICGDNNINPGETCDGNNYNGLGCSSFDNFTTGFLACSSSCQIDTSQCQNANNNVGTCEYQEVSAGTCQNNGYLSVDLTANWVWSPLNPSHSDPQNLEANCKSTVEDFQCPTQIPLPFFEWYNLVAAIAIVAIIYLIIGLRKKKR